MKKQDISRIQPNIIIGEDHDGWINLPAWKGFQVRKSASGSVAVEEQSDGTVKTHMQGVSVDYVYILSQSQFDAIQYLTQNAELVMDSLLNGLLKRYPKSKEIYQDQMPEITEIRDYENHIKLHYLHIMESEKDGFAYYGFELECSWDDEHGVGVMMHKDRVVAVGHAEESFNHFIPFRDNGTHGEQRINWPPTDEGVGRATKKWWEFWK